MLTCNQIHFVNVVHSVKKYYAYAISYNSIISNILYFGIQSAISAFHIAIATRYFVTLVATLRP